MRSIFGKVIVTGVLALPFAFLAGADKPHMSNTKASGKNWRWVTRRDSADPNKSNGSFAMVVDLVEETVGSGPPKVKGTLKFWTGVMPGTPAHYVNLHTYKLDPVTVNNGGEDNYKHEYCRWVGATSSTNPMEPPITVYASLFKAHGHGKGDNHRRLVIRFKYPPMGEALKAPVSDCCNDEPDDDVLEEENNPPDPPDGP